ncbi:MAG: hypothetical protein WBB74_05225 [Gaiellaceae bacterium]
MLLRLMEIGERVKYRGRVCVVRGLEPMSVPDRRVELEDAETGERLLAPVAEVEQEPPASDPAQ